MGWLAEGTAREFRCLRLRAEPAIPPPPLLPWRWPRDWFAVFEYRGSPEGIDDACRWMASTWPGAVGLRLGYGPLFSLLEAAVHPTETRARLHCPVRPLHAARKAEEGSQSRLTS